MTRVLLRLYLRDDRPLGPGKVQLLESIHDTGSISEAARAMKMSYRAAWLLVDSLNKKVNAVLTDSKIEARLAELGTTAFVHSWTDIGKFVAEETGKWGKVVKASGAKPE